MDNLSGVVPLPLVGRGRGGGPRNGYFLLSKF
jgi:hypothetical protein